MAEARPTYEELQARVAELEREQAAIRGVSQRTNEHPADRDGALAIENARLASELQARNSEVIEALEHQQGTSAVRAAHAEMAIENERLFNELQERNREVTEALDQQIAMSEVLSIISSSATDAVPVLQAVTERSARLCGVPQSRLELIDGDTVVVLAAVGPSTRDVGTRRPLAGLGGITGEALRSKAAVHFFGSGEEYLRRFPGTPQAEDSFTVLVLPLLRDREVLGFLGVNRPDAVPFTAKQIMLMQTFADQAVIAIENARLFNELQERNAGLRQALEREEATSGVLRIIARSPAALEAVVHELARRAADLTTAGDAQVLLVEDNGVRVAATYPVDHPAAPSDPVFPLSGETMGSRAILESRTVHVFDASEMEREFPRSYVRMLEWGFKTVLAAPMLRDGRAVGAILIRNTVAEPFPPAAVALAETFADQAVIAIENARLFNELQDRNREVTEALDQQTAMAGVLQAISSSPTDLQPVLTAILEGATRLCDASSARVWQLQGDELVTLARAGSDADSEAHYTLNPGLVAARALLQTRTIHVPDILARDADEYPESRERSLQLGWRAIVATPLVREGIGIGVLSVFQAEPRPFTDRQIALLEAFADQAVIAIENARLFNELQERNREVTEALERQTAMAEVLGIIANSATDAAPVLQAVTERAARLCGAQNGSLFIREGEVTRTVGHFGGQDDRHVVGQAQPLTSGRFAAGVFREKSVMRFAGTQEQFVDAYPDSASSANEAARHVAVLLIPLFRGPEVIGALGLNRMDAADFSDAEVALVQAFADQAVIAIENARLFNELQESNREVTEALDQQAGMAEVLRVIGSNPTDLSAVFQSLAETLKRLVAAKIGYVGYLGDGVWREWSSAINQFSEAPATEVPDRSAVPTVAARERRTIHICGSITEWEPEYPYAAAFQRAQGHTEVAIYAAPILRRGVGIGAVAVIRERAVPFSERERALVESFADQAVIAIENARLFNELQERNREVTEALEQQQGTSAVLELISRSPTDLEGVLVAVCQAAIRLCDADEAYLALIEDGEEVTRMDLTNGEVRWYDAAELGINRRRPADTAFLEDRTVHVHGPVGEVVAQFPELLNPPGEGIAVLAMPLRGAAGLLGFICVRRREDRAFSAREVAVIETFAAQATIAIENARLFNELQDRNRDVTEALDTQTAMAEVLEIISRSPTDLQSVLDAVVERAARLTETGASITLLNGEEGDLVAAWLGGRKVRAVSLSRPLSFPDVRNAKFISSVPYVERRTISLSGGAGALGELFPGDGEVQARLGVQYGSIVAVPLIRRAEAFGAFWATRPSPEPYTARQISLMEAFAGQAVIAIENARLFNELQERNREVTEALDTQTAMAEVLSIISGSITDARPVLDAVIRSAARLCEADYGVIFRPDGDILRSVASFGDDETLPPAQLANDATTISGRVLLEKRTISVDDLGAAAVRREYAGYEHLDAQRYFPTVLVAPLLRDTDAIGTISLGRRAALPFSRQHVALL
ncbi:MAG: GAF domain-containing protein, partial [Chloroflexota bacterium]